MPNFGAQVLQMHSEMEIFKETNANPHFKVGFPSSIVSIQLESSTLAAAAWTAFGYDYYHYSGVIVFYCTFDIVGITG